MSFTRRPSDQAPFPPKQEPQQRYQPIAMHSPDQSSSAPMDPYMRRPSDDSYPKSDSLPPLKAKIPSAAYEYKSYATRPEYRSDQPYQPTSPPNTSAFRPSLSPASTGSSWDYSDARMQQIYRDRTFHQVIYTSLSLLSNLN